MGLISNRKDVHSELDLLQLVRSELRGTGPSPGESEYTKLLLKHGHVVLADSESPRPVGNVVETPTDSGSEIAPLPTEPKPKPRRGKSKRTTAHARKRSLEETALRLKGQTVRKLRNGANSTD